MKRKFLSLVMCLMLCLSSMLVLSACKKNPKEISEVQAAQELNKAMQTLEETKSIKISVEYPEIYAEEMKLMFDFLIIATEETAYVDMTMFGFAVENWTLKENGIWTQYTVTADPFNDGGFLYEKSVMQELESFLEDDMAEDSFESLDFENFVEASVLEGETSIVFEEEGAKVTAKIVDGKLVAIETKEDNMTMTVKIGYGDFSAEIPVIPEKSQEAKWDMVSEIVLEGVDTELEQGEAIDLSDAVLKFYPNVSEDEDEFILIDLDDATITNDEVNKKIIVKYLGLTYELEYSIEEPAGDQ